MTPTNHGSSEKPDTPPRQLRVKPRKKLDWAQDSVSRKKHEARHRLHPRPFFSRIGTWLKASARLPSRPAVRVTALLLCLAGLTACYTASKSAEKAISVLAVKKELPVYSVDRADNTIAVTFDASWGAENTPKLLDILDEYNAKCTFFLVGLWVDKYPEMVKTIVERGHEIGNHSDSHPHMSQLSDEKNLEELRMMSDKVEKLTSVRPTLFRPPYGDYDDAVVRLSRQAGYECVQWSVDSLDWKNISPEDMIRRAGTVKSGDIILFHNDSKYLLDALPTILEGYKKQGLSMVKASEILLQGATTIDVQGKQHAAAATPAPSASPGQAT